MKSKISATILSLAAFGLLFGLADAQSKYQKQNYGSYTEFIENPEAFALEHAIEGETDFSDSGGDGVDETMEASGIGLASNDFGNNVAGAYYQCPTCSPFGTSIKTIHADGTLVAASTAEGETAGYGNWKKVGPKTIEVTAVVYGIGGTFTARVTETMTFANDFDSYTGTLVTAVWFGTPDILDNPPPPDICTADFGEFPISGERVAVAYPSCE